MNQELVAWQTEAKKRITAGTPPIIYRWVEVSVPSEINELIVGNFDFAELQAAGLSGWKIESVIPKTNGIGLKNGNLNNAFQTWGGGIGGNVVGAFVLLSKCVSDLESDDGIFATDLAEALIEAGHVI